MCSEFRPASPVVILASLFHKVRKKTREVEQRQSRVQSMLRWVTYDIWEARVSLTIPETLAENRDEFGKIWKIYGGWAKFSSFQPLASVLALKTKKPTVVHIRCKLTMNQQRQRQSQSHGRPKKRKVCNEHDVDTDASLNEDDPPKKWHLSHVVILRRLHIKWVSSRTILSPRRPILWARSLSKPYIKRFRKK